MCHAEPVAPGDGCGLPHGSGNFSCPARSRSVGATFEQRARQFLERRGLAFVAANVTMRGGELDLVMRTPDGTLVFVEVRARRSTRHGGAAASVGWRKRRRLVAAALHFWVRHGAGAACRFDVVAFEAGRLEWLRDAFRADDA
ncbi:YraN family protein [Burkholderia sp. Bp9031]|uniref:YraN family protein n=1 Tax=Burkholderia sp. Bp9031 TaxID=2184566 RepID=UPI00156EA18A|nr:MULTISPECIES: YraN family protein [Burkholderia]